MNGMKRTRMQKDEKRQNVEKKKTVEQNSLMAVAWMPTGPAMKCFASKLQLAGYYITAPYPTILLVMHTNLNSLIIHWMDSSQNWFNKCLQNQKNKTKSKGRAHTKK